MDEQTQGEPTAGATGNGTGGAMTATEQKGKDVGLTGLLLLGAYLVLLTGLALYAIVALWPRPCPEGTVALGRFLFWTFPRGCEVALILLVFSTGVLGGLIHALRSLYWYVGHRNLKTSWLAMYLLLPLVSGSLGVVFYIVIRGGLFSPDLGSDAMNPIGFAAVSAIVGLFSEQAVRKLKQVAGTLFAEAEQGRDTTPPAGLNSDTDDKAPKT
jgi:hypothetical protein